MRTAKSILGETGEKIAAELLVQEGYRILERNYRCRGGEIDLVAEEGDVLVFVEVRSRKTDAFGDPLETVDFIKQSRLARAAQHYLASNKEIERPVRFDVVGIVFTPELRRTLVRGAFEPGSSW